MAEPLALFGRWCPVCKTLKAEWAFYPNCFDCKECRKASVKRYNDRNREKVRIAGRKNWDGLKADPLAYAAYMEKKAKHRKSEKYRKWMREYMRKRRAAAKNGETQKPDGTQPADLAGN